MKSQTKLAILAIFLTVSFISGSSAYADSLGDKKTFLVDKSYDKYGRTSVPATLIKVTNKSYFYIDDGYWNLQSDYTKTTMLQSLDKIAAEFDQNIYPKQTEFWGSEPNPGVDNDPRLTIFFNELVKDNGGYFYSANLYPKSLAPDSNEREMLVISATSIGDEYIKTFMAHELQHLISFSKKEMAFNKSEETWLNELRSEYSSRLLGYDGEAQSGSQRRVRSFMEEPSDSLTLWPNTQYDYAAVALFGRYLADQYGPDILSETLSMPYVGIDSINQFFRLRGINETFAGVFEKWMVANFQNSTLNNKAYGYLDQNLTSLRVSPEENFVNFGSSEVNFSYPLKEWQPSWHRYYVQLDSNNSIKLEYNAGGYSKVMYLDNLGRIGLLPGETFITNPGGLSYFILMPVNEGGPEMTLNVRATKVAVQKDMQFLSYVAEGSLIKRPNEPEIYVVSGKYKRYLHPDVIKLYGHLNPDNAISLPGEIFDSYLTANYVKSINDKKVYSIWPDGTKHWLNITGERFTESGRDWGSIFTINDSELNYYQLGSQITR